MTERCDWRGSVWQLLSFRETGTRNIVGIRTVEIRIMSWAENIRELAFEHAPVGLVVTESRVIRTCNPRFAEMFGYERDELTDRSFAILSSFARTRRKYS